MKKIVQRILWTAVFVMLPATAMADTMMASQSYNGNEMTDRMGRNQLGVDIAGALPTDDISNALYVGADWNYGLSQWLAVGAEVGWQGTNFDFDDKDVDIVTAFGDLIARTNVPEWAAQPYAVVGFGILHASSDVDNFDDDDTSFAMKFGAGFDWFLNRNWILNFEAAYIATGGDLPASNGVTEELDHWRVGGGLKYAF